MSHKTNFNFLLIFFFWFSQLICLDTKTINCFDNKKINKKEIYTKTLNCIKNKEIDNKKKENKEIDNKKKENKEIDTKTINCINKKEIYKKKKSKKEIYKKKKSKKEIYKKKKSKKEIYKKKKSKKEIYKKKKSKKEIDKKEKDKKEIDKKEKDKKEIDKKEKDKKEIDKKEIDKKEKDKKEIDKKEKDKKEIDKKEIDKKEKDKKEIDKKEKDKKEIDKKEKDKKEKDKKEIFNPAFFIKNHIIDSHKWEFFKKKDKDYFIPLPIILFDKKLKLFLSSKFYQGKNLVLKKKKYYRLFNEKIYKTNSEGNLEIDDKGYILNKNPFDFSITKDVFALIISLIILFLIFFKLSLTYKNKLPKSKFQNILEYIIIFIRDQIAIPNIGKPYYKLYFPFLLTIFFFILINNLIGLIPTGPNLTGNISVTLTLSTIVFFTIIFSANKDYWKHFFTMPDIPFLVRLLLIPIELFGLFIRPLTLCIRLFANITAGHIISMSFISLIFIFKNFFSIIISIPFSIFIFLLEILVSFLQAFIFTSLSALFLGISIKID